MALRQQEPVIPRVFHQPPASLDEALLQAGQRPTVNAASPSTCGKAVLSASDLNRAVRAIITPNRVPPAIPGVTPVSRNMIAAARDLYRDESFVVELSETVYALDSTTIDLCLSLFPWGKFRRRKSVVKLHTLLDLRGSIPTNVYVTGGQVHDVNILDGLLPEAGAFYLLDRGYVDFARLYTLAQACAFSVTRVKKNMQFYRRNSRPVERSAGLRSDQTILLTGVRTAQSYPIPCDASTISMPRTTPD
jgi:Transposase DDE domain